MASKSELQTILKEKYGINENISQDLNREECERLLALLGKDQSVVKLVGSFSQKNSSLWQNNANYGRMRSRAENKLESLKAEYRELEQSIETLEISKTELETRKRLLEQEREMLEAEARKLGSENAALASKVGVLTSRNDELFDANEQLKKDNKDLKNIVDAIKFRLARDTKTLLQYEDNEIRKALIRLFRWTLG